MKEYYKTEWGSIYHADSLDYMKTLNDGEVNLIMTSPPFGLVRKKDYGNVDAHGYLEWFRPFAEQFQRILKDAGSLVIDIGGAWIAGQPTRSLYHYELMIMLCREYGFHLAQEFFLVESVKTPYPRRMGQYPSYSSERRGELCVVVVKNTLAEGQQSPHLDTV